MVLGTEVLLSLVKEEALVTGLSKRELINPEGAGFDLRLGKVQRLIGAGFLGITERGTPDAELLMAFEEGKLRTFQLQPGQVVLSTTVESVKMPRDLTAIIEPRGTLYRSGVIMRGGNVAPGYEGTLSFPLYNAHTVPMSIEMGARFVHIIFLQVFGDANVYRGQWAGGREIAAVREVQV